jgi:type II secretory pathway component GspD/PulD (secretin)
VKLLAKSFQPFAQADDESGTILTITPRVSQKYEITLDIKTEVSDVVARGENNLPVVTRRTTHNTLRIRDGGTAVIAGIKDNRSRLDRTATPGLGHVPLVGKLFRNNSELTTSRQIAVFITAQLILDVELGQTLYDSGRPMLEAVGHEFTEAMKAVIDKTEQPNVRK